MDKSIHTPVKRQYAQFEMAVCHRRRVATTLNFLSFISIIMKAFLFNFGRKIFTDFEMAELGLKQGNLMDRKNFKIHCA